MNKWIVIAGTVLICVLLFLAPRTASLSENEGGAEMNSLVSEADALTEKARGFLTDSLKQVETKLSEMASSEDTDRKVKGLDSLSGFWFGLGQPVLSAIYAEKAAIASGNPDDWKKAADLFLLTARNTSDEGRNTLYSSAIRCYENAMDEGHHNLDTRVDLAVCYVESSPDPMKGIGMLREVLEADSNNVKAHLNLGYFSIRSGQLDKAVERFRKVLELDPSYHDAHLYLGDLYERMEQPEKAIAEYESYQETVKDSVVKADIDRYLEKLKKEVKP